MVRLIQAALAMWGLFGKKGERHVDGLFCDETKNGIGAWRRIMRLDEDDRYKLEVSRGWS
jgi:hypothetical protein